MGAWPALLPGVAGHGLPGAAAAVSADALEPSVWAHLLELAVGERITGLLVDAILGGALPATDEQAGEAQRELRASMVTALALEATLVKTATTLDEAGVDYRVLKGTAVAHLDYPRPWLRSFGDVDLLVRSSQYDRAVGALVRAGHRRNFPEPRPGFDRRFGKGSCLVGPAGYEIDLHRSLAMGPYGLRIRLDDLWHRSSTFDVAGRLFRALAPEERFLHACFHAVLGNSPPRLAAVRDVAQMHLARPLDVDLVRRLSSSWGADAVVAGAVRLSAELLGLTTDTPLTRWALQFTPDRRDRHALAVYSRASQSYAAKSFAAVRSIPGIREKAAFVLTLAFPSRGYLAQRRQSATGRWRRGVSEVRRSRRLH
jgi:hypothetical protein